MQKSLSFASGIFVSESFEGGFRRDANVNDYFQRLRQHVSVVIDALVFKKVEKQTKKRKKND